MPDRPDSPHGPGSPASGSEPTQARPGPPPGPAGSPWGQAPPPQQVPYPGYPPAPPAGPPHSPHGGGSGGRGSGGGRAVLVALLTVGLLALVGIAAATTILLTRDDGTDTATDDPSSAPTGEASSEPTTEPTTEPTSDPTSEPTGEPTSEPTSEPTGEDPPAPATGAVSYREFGDDWDFRFDNVELHARFTRGWDYDSCGPVEQDGALTDLGCQAATQWTYRALDGHLVLTHIVLTMDSPAAAKKAIDQELITEDSWQPDPSAVVQGPYSGRWEGDDTDRFVVITIETHDDKVRDAKGQEFVHYANADINGALLFR